MVVIETKLKKIPVKCNKCSYSYTIGGFGIDTVRLCSVSFEKGACRTCPIEYNADKRNWEYTKPKWCPLREQPQKGGD